MATAVSDDKFENPHLSSPRTETSHGYEFGGPIGSAIISFGSPVIILLTTFACNDISGCPAPSLLSPKTLTLDRLKEEVAWPGFSGLVSLKATAAVLGYFLLNALLYRIIPATEVDGTVLTCGGRLKYRLNVFASQMTILAAVLAGTIVQGANFPVYTFISDNYVQIVVINLVFAFSLATFVYVRSFQIKPGKRSDLRELAAGGRTGNIIYDWYMGRELNPRMILPIIGEVDLKEWFELRPGMLGWVLINLTWLAKQQRTYGRVNYSMIFVVTVQSIYVIDSWYNEAAVLTTIDITTDGLGFMLSFGDLVWVPFLYSSSARYLSVHPQELSFVGILAMIAISSIGLYIFRSSNSQKNQFRAEPDHPAVAHLRFITTHTGSKLITTGWWGAARHINYFGDWLQSWTYCLPTAAAGYAILTADAASRDTLASDTFVMADGRVVTSAGVKGWAVPFTYFYIVYFAVLLIHRERRDDYKCERKYGADWQTFKNIVTRRIVPGIY